MYSIINKYNHDQLQAKQKKLQKKKDKKSAPVSDHETEVDSTAEKQTLAEVKYAKFNLAVLDDDIN